MIRGSQPISLSWFARSSALRDNETIAKIQDQYNFAREPAKLAWDWTTDIIFAYNATNIAAAYNERTRRYIFSVLPAVQGQDSLCKRIITSCIRVKFQRLTGGLT